MKTASRWKIVHRNLHTIMQPVINNIQPASKMLAEELWQNNETQSFNHAIVDNEMQDSVTVIFSNFI